MEIRELVKRKRKARKIWHRTRNHSDKTSWNRISKLLHDKINEVKNKTFKIYLSKLSAENNSNYSLWKGTRCMKRPRSYVPLIRKDDRSWAHSDQDKADTYACHLERVFQLNDIVSELDVVQYPSLN
jgi:hypothetical protein